MTEIKTTIRKPIIRCTIQAISTGGGGGGLQDSANGLTDDGTTVEFGGQLTKNTNLDLQANILTFLSDFPDADLVFDGNQKKIILKGDGFFDYWLIEYEDDVSSAYGDRTLPDWAAVRAYADTKEYPRGTGTLTDGSVIAWNVNSKLDSRFFLNTTQSTITLQFSNIADYSVHNLLIKKTITGDTVITLSGTGYTFRGPDGADLGTTPTLTLSGAQNSRFEISFANYGDAESTDKVVNVTQINELT